jgi:hypothetical protein
MTRSRRLAAVVIAVVGVVLDAVLFLVGPDGSAGAVLGISALVLVALQITAPNNYL